MGVSFTVQLIIYEVVSFLLEVFLAFFAHETVRVAILVLNLDNHPTEKKTRRTKTVIMSWKEIKWGMI